MACKQSFMVGATVAAWLGVMGATFAPSAAHAQSDDEGEAGATVDINALFDRAARRAERGDRQSAIRTFKEILPHAPWWSDVAFNIATLAEDGQQWADCAFYFRRYLLLEPDEPDRNRLTSRMTRCEERIPERGRLSVRAENLPEAHIFLNGIQMGTGELEQPVAAGLWTIEIQRIDHEPFHTTVEVRPGGTQTITAELVAVTYFGTLTIESNPPGAVVRVEGSEVGRTESARGLRYPIGRYLVQVELDGYHPWQRYVEVGRDRDTLVEAELMSARMRLDDF